MKNRSRRINGLQFLLLKKCVILLPVAALSLMVQPAFAGHKLYRYHDGQQAFEEAIRDYGREVGQGARNSARGIGQGARDYYERYGRPAKDFYDGAGAAIKSYRYRTPLPLMIIPDKYQGYEWQ